MNELSKSLVCIQMRSGVEIWIEQNKAGSLQEILDRANSSKFIHFENQTINTADIVGIFTASTMEQHTRRKNGEWLCKSNTWHGKGEKCECPSLEDKKLIERREEAIKNCQRGCVNGYKQNQSGVWKCDCIRDLFLKNN